MRRLFFISDDLNDLERVEKELEDNGISSPQFHVLSQNDAAVHHHHLHEVEAVLKKDVVHSMIRGAVMGAIAAALVLAIAWLAGWTESPAGWIPFIFLAIVVLGFCTWEGGLFGIQEPHYQFKRFQEALRQGKHVFFVDVTEQQQPLLTRVLSRHPRMQSAGEGDSAPSWVIEWHKNWNGFIKTMP